MELIFLDSFYKDIKKIIDQTIKKRLKNAIINLEETTGVAESKALLKIKGHPCAYRVKVGNYRLGCYLKSNTQLVVARFIKRNDIYNVFPK